MGECWLAERCEARGLIAVGQRSLLHDICTRRWHIPSRPPRREALVSLRLAGLFPSYTDNPIHLKSCWRETGLHTAHTSNAIEVLPDHWSRRKATQSQLQAEARALFTTTGITLPQAAHLGTNTGTAVLAERSWWIGASFPS